jgi:antitoxin ParD1/3/4
MRSYIDARVSDGNYGNYGNYGNTSEYLRELIRSDQQEQAARRLRDLLADAEDIAVVLAEITPQ